MSQATAKRNNPPPARWWPIGEALLALAVAGATFAVHDVGYVISHPFWLDESWVVDSTRAPLRLVPWLSSSTPLGWTLLLRLAFTGGLQRYRLVPLVFSAGAVLSAYYLGRELRLSRGVTTGLLTAAGVLLAPAMLVRDDLKQYTAEACLTVVLLVLVARLESEWSRRRLAWLAGVAGTGLLVTNTTIFVGLSAMAALGAVALACRQWRRLVQVAAATVGMVAVQAAIYLGIDKPRQSTALSSYWDAYYIPRDRGISGVVSFVRRAGRPVLPYLGSHSLLVVAGAVVAGIVTLVWIHRPALALVTPFTVIAVMAASAARRFPFLDLRTSTFWLVAVALLMAIGAAGVARAVQSLNCWAGAVVGLAALAVWAIVSTPYIGSHPLPNEDVRDQVAYLNAHRRPGDLVIVDYTANWGFAYYDQDVVPTFKHISYAAVGFMATYPKDPWIIQMSGYQAGDVARACSVAAAYVARHRRARVWIVRSHMEPAEAARWAIDLRGRSITVFDVGPEPLLSYQAARPRP